MMARSIFLLPRLLALCLCLRPAPAQEDAERRADLCKLPPEQGPCRGRIPRFYYSASSKRCELFTYGGCQGNANNFKTEEDCVAACGDRAVCKLQSDPGPCDALVPRWFHNPQARKCESFNYGSCGGNGNNFKTEEACLRLCQGTVECPPPTLHCVWSFPPLCGPRRPCAPGKTCCYHQCRFQCLDLLKEKAGTCPPDPVRCSQPQPNECGRDYECSAQLKCCHWRCARRCVEPVQE